MDTQVNAGELPLKEETLITNDGNTITTYKGYPLRGQRADDAEAWAVEKEVTTISNEGNTIATVRTWAGGNTAKTNKWSLRATLTYTQL